MGRNEENYWHLHQANNNPSEVRYTTHQKHPMDRGHSNEKESLIFFAETIGTSIRKGFEMPKRDCLMFDGNPMNYPRFIENFKTNIEEREQSPQVRLAYLIQFCTGVAKEAISNCVMLSEDEGCLKAREILHNSFRQNHIIICAYINKVTKGGVIRDGEYDKLQQLARDMENCKINLTQLGCELEINAQSNLEIVSRLPRYYKQSWQRKHLHFWRKVKCLPSRTSRIMSQQRQNWQVVPLDG